MASLLEPRASPSTAIECLPAEPTRGAGVSARIQAPGRAILGLMSAPAHAVHYTWAEYLALETASNVKHEYLDGQIYAMAGGTPQHAALQLAVPNLLFPQLRAGRCRAHGSDLRIRVLATGLATYPDVTIICGPRQVDPEDRNSVVNPTLLVEVPSPSTEEYDRGEKLAHYQRIPSLRQYVLVSAEEHRVEVWTRDAEGAWSSERWTDGEVAELGSIGARLDVRELYEAAAEGAA
jgi:Uma2 family endonuclease